MDQTTFVDALKACLAAGITRVALAEEFKVTEGTIDRWEQRRSRPATSILPIVTQRLQEMLPTPS